MHQKHSMPTPESCYSRIHYPQVDQSPCTRELTRKGYEALQEASDFECGKTISRPRSLLSTLIGSPSGGYYNRHMGITMAFYYEMGN